MPQGRGAHLTWPGTATGEAPWGRDDQRRDQRGAASADDQCSSVVRACREEGIKKTKHYNRRNHKKNTETTKLGTVKETQRVRGGGKTANGVRTEEGPKKNTRKQPTQS